jgi:hypothetical protein
MGESLWQVCARPLAGQAALHNWRCVGRLQFAQKEEEKKK